jgi:maltose alpha-D-glucosyltransferase/alpha-amylase
LRSLDYAAAFAASSGPGDLGEAAELRKQQILQQFAPTAGAAFLIAYQEAVHAGNAESADDANSSLLQLFVLEKSAYEVCYEAANRPTWILVPLNDMAAIIDHLLALPQGEQSDD